MYLTELTDFDNIGWKLHLPVMDNASDPLTRDICNFLDEKYGIKSPTGGGEFRVSKNGSNVYKVGCGGSFKNSKGMTIYGITGSPDETFDLAKEIEEKFGARIKKLGTSLNKGEYPITESVSTRFVLADNPTIMTDYCRHDGFGKLTGTLVNPKFPSWVKGNVALENEFRAGYSMLECIDNCGEIVTGKMQNGIPKPILEAFGPNFLKEYPDLLKTIPDRVKNGNLTFAKHVLKSLGSGHIYTQLELDRDIDLLGRRVSLNMLSGPEYIRKTQVELPSKLGKYVTDFNNEARLSHVLSMDENILKQALNELKKDSPEVFDNLVKHYDEISGRHFSLKKPQIKSLVETINKRSLTARPQNQIVAELASEWNSVPNTKPATSTTSKATWVDDIVAKFNSKGGKIGLCVVGAVALAGVATSIFAQSDNKELLATNKPSTQTNIYGNCFTMSKGNMTV